MTDIEILTGYVTKLESLYKLYDKNIINNLLYTSSKIKIQFEELYNKMIVLIKTTNTNDLLYKLLEKRILNLDKIYHTGFSFLINTNYEILNSDLND